MTENASQSAPPITFVISEIVEPDRIEEYEVWTRNVTQAASQYEGFLGADIIRPRDHEHPEYVIIVKFATYSHWKNWTMSATYHKWLEKSRELVSGRTTQELPGGLEIWFTLPRNAARQITPAYYKQVVIGVLSVYPLILLAQVLLSPLLNRLPIHDLLKLLISVTFVSALLTYPVLPWLTQLLGFWLYPPVRKQKQRSL